MQHRPKVIVIGDLMLDRYWFGPSQRISPEAPVPVIHVSEQKNCVGGAGNVAMNVAAQGGECYLVGSVGADEAGQVLVSLCQAAGICTHFIQLADNHPTTVKLRALSMAQQLLRLDFESKQAISFERIKAQLAPIIEKADVVVLSDYAKGMLSDVQSIIEYIKQFDVPILVDPKSASFDSYKGATVLTPNFLEFETAIGHKVDTEDFLLNAGEAMRQTLELDVLLVTRGEKGMTAIAKDEPFTIPTVAKEVYDVTGAGDTVLATLAMELAKKESLRTAVATANRAAAIAVSKVGTGVVSTSELEEHATDSHHKVIELKHLLANRRQCKLKSKTVVMTNGCFDILHPGHIKSLQESKQMGDILIVAVNEDESIRQLKGPERPIHPLWHRMEVLAALECVDYVISFGEETPLELIKSLLPDVYTKGGDYQKQDIVGADVIEQNGGKVVVIPLVPDCATTKTIDQIKQQEKLLEGMS